MNSACQVLRQTISYYTVILENLLSGTFSLTFGMRTVLCTRIQCTGVLSDNISSVHPSKIQVMINAVQSDHEPNVRRVLQYQAEEE